MSRVGSYRELRVYRQAFRRAMAIRELVGSFPPEERFDLVAQLRRSSRSVCANLAEAWRRRHYPKAFAAKLIDAEAEASETRVHLEIAAACGYITDREFTDFDDAYDRIIAQLVVMRTHPDRWRPHSPSGPTDAHPEDEGASPTDNAPSSPTDARPASNNACPGDNTPSGPADVRTDNSGASPTDKAPSRPQ